MTQASTRPGVGWDDRSARSSRGGRRCRASSELWDHGSLLYSVRPPGKRPTMPDQILPSVSEADVVKRRQAMNYAIDSSRIEGLTVSSEVVAIMERQNRGEITTDEAIALVHEFHGRP